MPHLYDTFTLRGVTLRNRIGVSPMCQYSSEDGFANDWHLVHLGSRAVGGAGLVITEATAVEARGRISPQDLGIWKDDHIDMLRRITDFVKSQGAVPGVQLAHAGRKASTRVPWEGREAVPESEGGWTPVAPSQIEFTDNYPLPDAMTSEQIDDVTANFRAAAQRAAQAGFDWIEIHAAHGYLLHNFHSPLANQRDDEYGGSFENRVRFTLAVTRQIREVWADDKPLTVRLSCTDWVDGGWTLDESVELAKLLKAEGVDLIDCSSGGTVPKAEIPVGASYQVPFAEAIRQQADLPTAAVGLISQPMQADDIIRTGRADIVLMAREFLRDPYWALHAAPVVHKTDRAAVPNQYLRGY